MADILNTGISGLLAFRRNLEVISHNITNADTPGYSRQRAELTTRPAQFLGSGYIGNGVDVASVRRLYNQFVVASMHSSNSELNRLQTLHSLSGSIDSLLADSSAGVAPSLSKFYAALGDLSNDPSSIPVRQSLLSSAGILVDRFHYLDQRIEDISHQIDNRVKAGVQDINTIADSIANLNRQIVKARTAAIGQPPNDLLDKRDHLVQQLSEKVNVRVAKQDNGYYNIFIGNGQALIVGGNATKLGIQSDPYNPTRVAVTLGGAVVTSQITGGSVGGALDARREVLDPARRALGRAAAGLAVSVNKQHHLGMDLNGQLGGDFFSVGSPQVLANNLNTGTATVSATFSDISKLSIDNYIMKYDGANWSLAKANTGQAVTMTGTGTTADPFVADGMKIVVSAGAAAGDRFLIQPTTTTAESLKLAISDPTEVAAAAPIRTSFAAANMGDATITKGEVTDPTNPNLLNTVTIKFTSATTYSINGTGSYAYTSGNPITLNGWQTTINGTPQTGDVFTIQSNAGGVGDNRNAIALGGLQLKGVLEGGASSISQAYGKLVARVGTQTHQAEVNANAQQVLYTQAQKSQQAVSGVNLDEEAANLMRYQQAYQAAAHVINSARVIFSSLMKAMS